VKKRERNEALDCRVYAMAALDDLGIRNWDKLEKNLQAAAAKGKDESAVDPGDTPPAAAVVDDGIPIITGKPKKSRKEGPRSSWAGSWDR
jgi:phage terminase large subunit GpA-like protein